MTDTKLTLIPRSIITPRGEVATLWWPDNQPIPPGHTIQIAEPMSIHARAHTLEFVRSH